MGRFRRAVWAFGLLGAIACSSEGAERGAGGESAGRVALDPTRAGELPAAVLGAAPPPSGQTVRYFEGDSAARGYLAVPDGAGPFPALIIVHEWNGLVDRIRQMADALAAEGYVTLAADLYSGRTGRTPEENIALVNMTRAEPQKVIANLNAAVRYLRARPDVTGRIGTVGWCFGGGIALAFGLDGENHDATAIFYGRLVTDPAVLASLTHEVYGTFGRLDQGPNTAQVDSFAAALRAAGVPNDIHIYDDVDHGFWLYVDEEPDVRRAAALDAWSRLRSYLARTLR
jgi:carboxymethylenebutenolidase